MLGVWLGVLIIWFVWLSGKFSFFVLNDIENESESNVFKNEDENVLLIIKVLRYLKILIVWY